MRRIRMLLVTLIAIATGVVVVSAALVAIVWWQQERIVFQPPPHAPPAPPDVRRVEYQANDGQSLHGYLVEPGVVGAPTHQPIGLVIAFHGNADLAVWQIPWARELTRRSGWRVLLAEYRGYAGTGGSPTYEAAKRDARAAYAFGRQHIGVDSEDAIALFGHSLGSAIATELATELATDLPPGRENGPAWTGSHPRLTALLLQSPFTSARDMARVISTRPVHLLWNVISRVHYDTRAQVAVLDVPVWVAHGEQDWLVPVWMGRTVFAAAQRPGQLLLVPGAGHNDVEAVAGEAYWRWITGALAGPMSARATGR